jgi:hypothetical protein
MQIEKTSDVVAICTECQQETVFNRPLYWQDIFNHWFSSFQESDETMILRYEHSDILTEHKVGYYMCHECSKKYERKKHTDNLEQLVC